MEFIENRVFEAAPGVFVRNAVDNCAWVDLGSGVATIDALEEPDMAPVIQNDIAQTVGKPHASIKMIEKKKGLIRSRREGNARKYKKLPAVINGVPSFSDLFITQVSGLAKLYLKAFLLASSDT